MCIFRPSPSFAAHLSFSHCCRWASLAVRVSLAQAHLPILRGLVVHRGRVAESFDAPQRRVHELPILLIFIYASLDLILVAIIGEAFVDHRLAERGH